MREAGLIFSGEYVHQLDEKVRFKLPKRMEEIFTDELGIKCVLMRMPERCVAIYPQKFWQKEFGKYLESVKAKMPGNAKYRTFTRMIASNSFETKIGAQGRVALTDVHKEFLGIEAGGNVVIVGAGERIEIWSEDEWRQQQGKELEGFYDLLEDVSKSMEESGESGVESGEEE
jgi:MraZ protein